MFGHFITGYLFIILFIHCGYSSPLRLYNTRPGIHPFGNIQKVPSLSTNNIYDASISNSIASATANKLIFSEIVKDKNGNILFADQTNNEIKRITPSGLLTILAGKTKPGFRNGKYAEALFNRPSSLAVDQKGNVYVADMGNNMIRIITKDSVVGTFAGNILPGHKDSSLLESLFNSPCSLAIDNDNLFIADFGNNAIRKISLSNNTVSTIAGKPQPGCINGIGGQALFNGPISIAFDKQHSNLYVADIGNNAIRRIDQNLYVTSLQLKEPAIPHSFYIAPANIETLIQAPCGLTFDKSECLYVVTLFDRTIKKIDLRNNNRTTTLIPGNNTQGIPQAQVMLHEALANKAYLRGPIGLLFDENFNLYIF
jgi:Uncharacterized conserved protein